MGVDGHALRWHRFWRRRFLVAVAVFATPVFGLLLYAACAPYVSPAERMPVPGTVVLAADGSVLQRDGREGFRIPVTIEQVAPAVIDATISAEDQRFEKHPGIDPIAMARAALHWRDNPSGASTITQQLARRLYLDGGEGPVLIRKPREALIALQLEAHESKDTILEAYLNAVYYGRGAYGIEAAARIYFGVSAQNLDLAQAAFLAGLPQLPSAYDPASELVAARARQRYVLDRMASDGRISRAEARAAADRDLAFVPDLEPAVAQHYVQFALDELARLRPDLAGAKGLVIETALDTSLQANAQQTAALRVEELNERGVGNAAVVALDPRTGALLAMVGSVDWFDTANGGQNNMALALRQPGSALKPFLYAAALERGYTAATPLLDVATTFETPTGPYTPLNYDRRFHGVVPLRVALASSYNVPAVATLEDIGIERFLDTAHRFGLRTLTDTERYGLAVVLGGGEVRLLDLAGAYGTLANGGLRNEPFAVTRVRDHSGRVVYERPAPQPERVTSEQVAFVLSDILSDPEARMPGFGEVNPLTLSFPAAVKTGTTTGFRDNWTAGYTPELVVAAWAGNTDGRPMEGVSGVDGAGPIWRDVMEAAARSRSLAWHPAPDGLARATVCSPTGLKPGPDCPSPVREWFLAGTAPTQTETYYTRDDAGRLLVRPPAEARDWAVQAGLALAPGGPDHLALVRVVAPTAGSVFYLAPELEQQQLLLRASVPPGTTRVSFHVDGVAAGTAPGDDARLLWRLSPGAHVLSVTAELPGGGTAAATTTYEVRTR